MGCVKPTEPRDSAAQYRQVLFPGADVGAELLRDHAARLGEMAEVVHRPRREKLAERDRAQSRVRSPAVHLLGLEIETADVGEVLLAQLAEAPQEPLDRLGAVPTKALAIERRERPGFPVLQDDADARYPVRFFAEDQVAEHVTWAVGV